MLERYLFKPMKKIATAIGTSPFEASIPESSEVKDEISVISNSVRDNLNKKYEAMDEVSSMVAHDLRNPLQGIRGASFYLKKKLSQHLGQKEIEMFKTIDNCVDYSNKIVSDLLDYSRKVELAYTKTTLKGLVESSLSGTLKPNGITVTNQVSDNFEVSVDKIKIERVFANLIKNAFDAMPNGGTLQIASERIGSHVKINFSDNGTGMSKEVLAKLWKPFFTTKARGMGIGLSICKRIIEAHNGKIEVKSTPEIGTTFSIFLPLSS